METLLLLPKPKFTDPDCAPPFYQNEGFSLPTKIEKGEFSFFHKPVTNTLPTKTTTILEVYNRVVSENYKPQTLVLRCLSDAAVARSYKSRNFDFICASGVFTKRSESGLIKHSGLLTLDFDHVPYPAKLKINLVHDPNFETAFSFISPSGDGLKWFVEIDLVKYTHLEWFLGLQHYVKASYHLEIDQSGKDVSRCCFLPYDPEAYINPKYLL